jgi:hypothetical protein
MTTPKNVTPEEIVSEIINNFLGFTGTKSEDSPKAEAPVDNVAEFNRLLAKAEQSAAGSDNEADVLLAIAASHLRLVETVISFQK